MHAYPSACGARNMDTSRPMAASTAVANVNTAAIRTAAHDSPATVGHRAGRTFTGTSTATYLRWCLTVPLSRDIYPGRPGIYKPRPGAGRSGRANGAEQKADQLGRVRSGTAGQIGPAVVRGDHGVHHGPADEGVKQQRDRGVRRELAAVDAAAHDVPRRQDLRVPHLRIVLGHPRDGGGLEPEPERDAAGVARVDVEHLGGQFD